MQWPANWFVIQQPGFGNQLVAGTHGDHGVDGSVMPLDTIKMRGHHFGGGSLPFSHHVHKARGGKFGQVQRVNSCQKRASKASSCIETREWVNPMVIKMRSSARQRFVGSV
ncbi:hypothetical protein DK59_3056 [Brucella abortus bv. 4 str. 292]|nr:hypothetical protein DK59_3056 [Brucella abortus bv. 4 str. 292]